MTVTTGYRWKLETVQQAAKDLVAQWAGTYERIAIAGSVRRGIGSVKDVEILVQPIFDDKPVVAVAAQLALFGAATSGSAASVERVSRLDTRLEELAAQGVIFKDRPNVNQKGLWGDKQKKFWIKAQHGDGIGYLPVDLFICTPPAEWGSLLVIRTGPAAFSERLMVYINDKTNLQQQDGRLIVRETGLSVTTPTEQAYFKILGLPWIEPQKRTAEWVQRWIRMRRTPVQYRPPSSTALSVNRLQISSGNRCQIGDTPQGKAAPDQPQAGEQTSAPDAGEVVPPVAQPIDSSKLLSQRIKDVLTRLPGAHPTVLIPRLGCDPVSFRLALRTLKTLNVVRENHYGGLWLVEESVDNTEEVELPDRPPDGYFDEEHEAVIFVKGSPISWSKGTIGADLSRPRGYGARLRIVPKRIRYTCDDEVRQALRIRLERRAGISEG